MAFLKTGDRVYCIDDEYGRIEGTIVDQSSVVYQIQWDDMRVISEHPITDDGIKKVRTKPVELQVGDKVKFTRQAVGYPTVILEGIIHSFNSKQSVGGVISYLAHVKAECEYGAALPYNHTLHLSELTKIL